VFDEVVTVRIACVAQVQRGTDQDEQVPDGSGALIGWWCCAVGEQNARVRMHGLQNQLYMQ
jgi:hypothetical protein